MASLLFNLGKKTYNQKNELHARFFSSKFDQRAATGIFVAPNFWKEKEQRVATPRTLNAETEQALKAKNELSALDSFIFDCYSKNTNAPIADKNWLKSCVLNFHNGTPAENLLLLTETIKKYTEHTRLSQKRKNQYFCVVNNVLQFEQEIKKKIYINSLSEKDVECFTKFLANEKSKDGKPIRHQNRINAILRQLRAVCTWSVKNELATTNPFARLQIQSDIYGTPTFLTIEERNRLYSFPFEIARERVQRDIFVFQCLIGCRVSDLLALKKNNVTPDGFLQYVQQKMLHQTEKTIRVPLTKTAKEIVARYADYDSDKLLPFTSVQRYNDMIKELLKKAEIDRLVLVIDKDTNEKKSVPIYEVSSSHLARRTFMANMYKKVKSERLVCSFTGHSRTSSALSRYTVVDDEMKIELIEKIE